MIHYGEENTERAREMTNFTTEAYCQTILFMKIKRVNTEAVVFVNHTVFLGCLLVIDKVQKTS